MKFTYALPVSCIATLALSATVDVQVGPGLSYSPDSVTAAKGDIIRFHFGSGHDVVSGKFSSPCQPDNVLYSGEPSDGDVFSMTVNSTDPMWIYCSVPRHCQGGMAMVINAPSNQNINAYKSAASSTSNSGTPNQVVGGLLNAPASSSSSSPSPSGSSSSSGAPSSTSSGSRSSSSPSSSTTSSASSSTSSSSASKALSSGSIAGSAFVMLAAAFGLTL